MRRRTVAPPKRPATILDTMPVGRVVSLDDGRYIVLRHVPGPSLSVEIEGIDAANLLLTRLVPAWKVRVPSQPDAELLERAARVLRRR